MKRWMFLVWMRGWLLHVENLPAETIPQPLAQQVRRLAQAMAFMGVPFHSDLSKNIEEALQKDSMADLDRLLETRILFHVTINPEFKVSNHRACIFKSGEKGLTWAVCLPGDLALIFSVAFFC